MFRVTAARLIVACAAPLALLPAQAQRAGGDDALRVTVSQNNDGSRTTYEIDPPNRKAVATTVDRAGRLASRIRYVLDDLGRFVSGEVFGPSDKFRFKTRYTYDGGGRLSEETRLTKDDVVTLKLVYSYDALGKQAGYSVYDGSGKLLGQTSSSSKSSSK